LYGVLRSPQYLILSWNKLEASLDLAVVSDDMFDAKSGQLLPAARPSASSIQGLKPQLFTTVFASGSKVDTLFGAALMAPHPYCLSLDRFCCSPAAHGA